MKKLSLSFLLAFLTGSFQICFGAKLGFSYTFEGGQKSWMPRSWIPTVTYQPLDCFPAINLTEVIQWGVPMFIAFKIGRVSKKSQDEKGTKSQDEKGAKEDYLAENVVNTFNKNMEFTKNTEIYISCKKYQNILELCYNSNNEYLYESLESIDPKNIFLGTTNINKMTNHSQQYSLLKKNLENKTYELISLSDLLDKAAKKTLEEFKPKTNMVPETNNSKSKNYVTEHPGAVAVGIVITATTLYGSYKFYQWLRPNESQTSSKVQIPPPRIQEEVPPQTTEAVQHEAVQHIQKPENIYSDGPACNEPIPELPKESSPQTLYEHLRRSG